MLKKKKIYFSEEIDNRIAGFAVSLTFIIAGLICFLQGAQKTVYSNSRISKTKNTIYRGKENGYSVICHENYWVTISNYSNRKGNN